MGGGGGGGGGFAGGLTRTVGLEPLAGVFPGTVFPGGVFVVAVVFAGALGAAGAVFPGGAFDVVVCPVAVPATSTSAIVHPSSSNEGAERRVFCRLRAGVGLCRIMADRCIARRRPEREGYEQQFESSGSDRGVNPVTFAGPTGSNAEWDLVKISKAGARDDTVVPIVL